MGKKKKMRLSEQILNLKVINLNGNNYVGKFEKTETGYKIFESVESKGNFEETIKSWIKAKNSNTLQTLTCEGSNISLISKEFSEQNQMEIEIIALKSEYAIKYALTDLQNSKI